LGARGASQNRENGKHQGGYSKAWEGKDVWENQGASRKSVHFLIDQIPKIKERWGLFLWIHEKRSQT